MAQRTVTTVAGTDSALVHFRVDYNQFMEFPPGEALHSDVVSVGGQSWRIDCYPRATRKFHRYVSIFLRHLTKYSSCNVKVIFEPFFLCNDGGPSPKMTKWAHVNEYHERGFFSVPDDDVGYPEFYERSALGRFVIDGQITFVCAIMVINELGPVPVPPSDIRDHLGHMLDDNAQETSDVSFIVDGEIFHAHRAVLTARSPVFKAQLFGSMIEATATSEPITLHEIAPATFRMMLQFIYTDAWPKEDDSPVEMFQDLLAAADRYALDRLKLICARKLWDSLSVDTVTATLACAETYGCPELMKKCLDFCVDGGGKSQEAVHR